VEAAQHAQQRAFPGTAAAYQRVLLAALEIEADVIQRGRLATRCGMTKHQIAQRQPAPVLVNADPSLRRMRQRRLTNGVAARGIGVLPRERLEVRSNRRNDSPGL